jgi:hypothetical protein
VGDLTRPVRTHGASIAFQDRPQCCPARIELPRASEGEDLV